jgi:hypothetical protein
MHPVSMEGTGATAPTKLYGNGVTITRTSEGLYKLTWASNPGTFVSWSWACGGATPSAMSGHTVSRDTFDTSTYSIEILLGEADDSVDDLEDNEFIDLVFWFKTSAV